MDIFDWLLSPIGQELQHAVIVFLIAAAGYLVYLTHRGVADSQAKLNAHLEQHVQDAVASVTSTTTSSGLSKPPIPPTI